MLRVLWNQQPPRTPTSIQSTALERCARENAANLTRSAPCFAITRSRPLSLVMTLCRAWAGDGAAGWLPFGPDAFSCGRCQAISASVARPNPPSAAMPFAASADPGALRVPGLQPHPFADSPRSCGPGQAAGRTRGSDRQPSSPTHEPLCSNRESLQLGRRVQATSSTTIGARRSSVFSRSAEPGAWTARCLCLERRAPSSATRVTCLGVRARTLERRAPGLTRESASTRLPGSEAPTRGFELHTPSFEPRA